MRKLAVLLAASCLAWTPSARAGATKTPAAHASAAHQQAQHQQHLYQQEVKRQQDLVKKQVQQQQQAYQKQMKAAQAMEKKMTQQQAKAAQGAPRPASNHHQATAGGAAAAVAGAPAAHAAASHARGHGYRTYTHRNNRVYRHHTRWPTQVDPETAALVHLKAALDGVGRGGTSTGKHVGALATALGNVVEVATPPSPTAVRELANHLTAGLSHRDTPHADTQTMALALRGVMNSTILPRNELTAVMNEHQAALRSAKFRAEDIAAIQASLKTIATQEHARR